MIKGEIWQVNLSPTKGSEQNGRRPVLVVSGNLLNKYAPVVFICPLTSKIKNYQGNVVLTPNKKNGLISTSEVMAMHLRSVSKDRLEKKIGEITLGQLHEIRKGIGEIIDLD